MNKSIHSEIYESLNRKGIHYYNIFGLHIYASCADELLKRDYAQKIADYAFSLNNDEFKAHNIQYEKPKIHNGTFCMSIINEIKGK